MSDKKIRTMVMAAVLAALTCVATMVVQIPSPMNGFVNLGDCFVLLSGWLLGPWWGGAAGGIGSMLADLLLGYGHYAPGTLIIKGLMALVGALIFKALGKSSVGALSVVSSVRSSWWAGYFGYAALLLGKGSALRPASPAIWCRVPWVSSPASCCCRWPAVPILKKRSACDILYGEPVFRLAISLLICI